MLFMVIRAARVFLAISSQRHHAQSCNGMRRFLLNGWMHCHSRGAFSVSLIQGCYRCEVRSKCIWIVAGLATYYRKRSGLVAFPFPACGQKVPLPSSAGLCDAAILVPTCSTCESPELTNLFFVSMISPMSPNNAHKTTIKTY